MENQNNNSNDQVLNQASQSASSVMGDGGQAPQQNQTETGGTPGRAWAIWGIIFAIIMPPVGLILSIVAYYKANKAGAPNGLAIAGIIISIVMAILHFVVLYGMMQNS